MTVLFFLPTLGGGGAEMNVVRLANGLHQQGMKLVVAVVRGPGVYASHLPTSVDVRVLYTGRVDSSTLRLIRSVGPLADLVDEVRPDVLVPVMPRPAIASLAAVRRCRHKPTVVLSIQDTIYPRARGFAATLLDKVERGVVRRVFPQAHHVIALSRGVANELASLIPELRNRIHVVHNIGMPLSSQIAAAEAEVAPRSAGRIRFLACGRLVEQKGFAYFLTAFAQVLRARDAELHLLGEGPLRGKLEEQASSLGISERVFFLGFRANPFRHMESADILVLSSLWEGFGNVLVEAMAIGTPVISTRCPHGPDEIITDGQNGLLVTPADSQALAAVMLRLSRDEALRNRLAKAGKERAQRFSVERISAEFADVLGRVSLRDGQSNGW